MRTDVSLLTHAHEGACHCGAIRATFKSTRSPGTLQIRACQCGFCRRHAAMTVSDPDGRVVLDIDQGKAGHYQFATRSAASLVCKSCGVYAGALLLEGDKAWSALNVRGLALPAFIDRIAEPVAYDAETAEQRITRRKSKWTPTEIRTRYYY